VSNRFRENRASTTPGAIHKPPDKDCADFDTLAEALAWHKEHPEDGLDADNDGRVCEALFPDQKPSRDKDEEDEDKVKVPTNIPAGL
jgi:hypothetical protein